MIMNYLKWRFFVKKKIFLPSQGIPNDRIAENYANASLPKNLTKERGVKITRLKTVNRERNNFSCNSLFFLCFLPHYTNKGNMNLPSLYGL